MRAVPAHAKVNLALDVAGRRSDGFHDLVTVIAAIDWHDLVCVGVRRGEGRTGITVTGQTADPAMVAPSALIQRAAAALRRLAEAEMGSDAARLDVTIAVDKRIPVAAGLGGGSADAAGVLRAGAAELATTLGVTVMPRKLAAAAAALGSDVPAQLAGGITLARGRGELLEPIVRAPRLHLAVAVVGACKTAAVYAALSDDERHDTGRAARLAATLAAGKPPRPRDYGSALESAARRLASGFAEALDSLRAATGMLWPLTGSGGAVFQPASDDIAAREAAAAARSHGFAARACRTLSVSAGAQDPPSPPTTIAP